MQRLTVLSVLLIASCFLSAMAHAAVPHLVRYQGTLVDTQQVPLEGPYTLTFRVYEAATGGSAVWQETQTAVPVVHGQFSVLLGQVTPLELAFDKTLWLSIQVNTDAEMSPRQQLSSVPYAYQAERATTAESAESAKTAETARTAQNMKTSAIEDDGSKFVPVGAIILWSGASCPAGYLRVSQLDEKFVVGGVSFNPAAGGSNTHDHGGSTGSHALTIGEMPPHNHGIRGHYHGGGDGPNWFPNTSDGVYTSTESAGGGQGHTHSIAPADSRPAFATVLLCQKN